MVVSGGITFKFQFLMTQPNTKSKELDSNSNAFTDFNSIGKHSANRRPLIDLLVFQKISKLKIMYENLKNTFENSFLIQWKNQLLTQTPFNLLTLTTTKLIQKLF